MQAVASQLNPYLEMSILAGGAAPGYRVQVHPYEIVL